MRPFFTLGLIFILSGCGLFQRRSPQINLIHYNIFELDSPKLQGEEGKEQLAVLESFLTPFFEENQPTIFSLNEVQFDKPQVPNAQYFTYGQNPRLLLDRLIGKDESKNWHISFTEANTGAKAKKYQGAYVTSRQERPKNKRKYADPVNYGLFPGQYSSALAAKYPIVSKVEITKLKWREFNPNAQVTKYQDGHGKRLSKDVELFDKSFNDSILNIDGHAVHVITLHAVPAYHFGNKKSPNYQRNADQLRFLEWYLTGKTDFKVDLPQEYAHIIPLTANDTYIAVGDWNTDLNNSRNPGSRVLQRLAKTGRLFPTEQKTLESAGFGPNKKEMTLDYFLHSKDLFLKSAQVLRPKEKRLFLGCGSDSLAQKEEVGRKWVTFKDKDSKKTCHVTISEAYYQAKTSSDHFPLFASFELQRQAP